MSSSLAIEAADASGRWYLLPGSANSFELLVSNGSDHAVLCKMGLDEPAGAGSVSPSTLTLKAGESRTVTLAFNPDWLSLRDRKAVITARNAAGTVVATFVHDLIAATSTDCSVSLGWKDEIAGEGALRGFVLACTVRSISSTPGVFEPEFVAHPSLRFPEPQRITLGPGESSTFDVPVIWNRSARDNEGWNHPRTIEVGVPVTHGRRSASAPWDLVQQHIEPYLTESDRAPVLARRPPPPQFTTPGGGAPAPAVSAGPVATMPEPTLTTTVTESPAARMARAEMEAGVAAGGMRLPPPPTTAPAPAPRRETVSVGRGTLALVALAFVAVVIVLYATVRGTSTFSISSAPVAVASSVPAGSGSTARAPAGHAHVGGKPRPGAHPRPGPTGAAPASTPQTTGAATSTTGTTATTASSNAPASAHKQAPPVRTTPARRVAVVTPPRMSPIDRNSLVQLADVGADYIRGGRMVRVSWDSYAQVRADVQLLDDHSAILSETQVGRREAAVLMVPRGYRGTLYVQVTAYDFNGERVESSAELPPR